VRCVIPGKPGCWSNLVSRLCCIAFVVLQAVRHQAAAVIAALALSSPPLLAVLFGECLEGVETFCQQLMLLAAPYTKRGPPTTSGSTTNSTGTGNVFGCLFPPKRHAHHAGGNAAPLVAPAS
jgi:hypothetical protein